VPVRKVAPWVVLLASVLVLAVPFAQPQTPTTSVKGNNDDLELVKRLIAARKEYQKALVALRLHYDKAGDLERKKWAEEELRHYHRVPQYAFILDLDVPPPTLQGTTNIPEANKLLTWAITFKDKGFGNDYLDNQRRAEILLQDLLTKYPQSDKISDAAFYLGDIYECKVYRQFRRAAAYYERCFQWNPKTHWDARMRAARLYDYEVKDRARAIELYREITTHEIDPKRIQEATKRLSEISAAPR
jgi:tetratricopeptide (TPR) repeat protein